MQLVAQHALTGPAERPGLPPPPYPRPPARDLPGPLLLLTLRRNSLAAWPAYAYRDTVVHRRFLGTDCFLLSDPAAARHVLTEAGAAYVRPVSARRLLRPGTGNGLLIAEGAEWRAQRRLLSPGFTPRSIERLLPAFAAAAGRLVEGLAGQPRARLGEALERASIDAAGWAMFGLDLLPQAERIGNLLRGYFTGAAKAQIFDFLAREESDFVWASRPRARFGRRWFAEVDALIAKRRALPPGPDLFSVLVAGQAAPDDVALRDQFAGMLAAGFETTAQAMFWTLFLLAGAPEEQARIGAELVARPPASVTASADFAAWPRLRACLLEALRLYPPSSVLSRVALGPDVAGGVRIPAGSLVMVSQWVMHRHERLWTAADRFRPERFAGQSLAVALARPGFMPFGAGPRTCLGAGLALTEATLLLAHLLARYRIGLEPGQRVMPRAIVSTRPDRQPWFTLAEVAR